jgi:nucleoside-diphosphate-sugar epimerase
VSESFWKEKKVLVTGADGFVGSHLCEALLQHGARVLAFVKSGPLKNLANLKGLEVARGDVLDYPSLLNATKLVDIVFHLAAITLIPETRAMVVHTFNVNSMGTLNVLMAAKENNVKKVVYVSTCHVYGKQERLPITEENIPKPIDIYSASKLTGEHLCTSFVEMFRMDVSISRAFNHFGPRQREEFLIPTVIAKLIRGEKLVLGNPEPTRDYSYVSDIVNGYLLLGEHGEPGQVYQFCSGIERSVKTIVEDIIEIGGFDAQIEWNPTARRVDIPRSFGSYSKAKKELGWEPSIPFEEGIKNTIAWYKSQIYSHKK